MNDRGFDLNARVDQRTSPNGQHEFTPTDRIAERSYFSAPPRGGLPVLEGQELLVFASNNYLGLAADTRVQNAARRAATTVGTGTGGSRIDCGDTVLHHDLERLLAETVETDRALVFPSEQAATVSTMCALEPDVVFADERAPSSVFDGCRLAGADAGSESDISVVRYAHRDPADLEAKLNARARDEGILETDSESASASESESGTDTDTETESWLVVTETVCRFDGTVSPLSAICDAAETFGAWVMVDESHATGLYANGGGVVQAEGVADRVDIQLGTLAGTLASQGGYVAGSTALIDLLSEERFQRTAGLNPPAVAAASEALHLARHSDRRDQLWENVAHLRDGLETMGYTVAGRSQICAIDVGDTATADTVARSLRERGIVVQQSRQPADAGGLRLTPIASHTSTDIVACLEAVQELTSLSSES